MTASVIVDDERRVDRLVIPLWVHGVAMIVAATTVLAILVRYCLHSYRGIRWDERLMSAWQVSEQTRVAVARVLVLVTVPSVAVLLVLCVAIALLRKRVAIAVGAVVLIGGATVTTQILKYQVFERLPHAGENSLPSGHTTVAVSVCLALVLVVPASWRLLVAPAAAAVGCAAGIATIVGSWHRPGDVVAGLAVCTAWLGIALIVVSVLQSHTREPVRRSQELPWLAFAGPVLVVLLMVWSRGIAVSGGLALVGAWLAVIVFAAAVGSVFAWLTSVANRALT